MCRTKLKHFNISYWLYLPLLISGIMSPVYAMELKPYEATYQTRVNGMKVRFKRRLKLDEQKLELSVTASWLLFGLRESSTAVFYKDSRLRPTKYIYKQRGLSHKHDKSLLFDWNENLVKDLLAPRREALEIDLPMYDKLSYQVQMRLDLMENPDLEHLQYAVTNGIRNRVYSFQRIKEEVINTPTGNLRTVQFRRAPDDDEHVIYLWLAVDWDYLLVRIDDYRKPGARVQRMILSSASMAGKQVNGI